MKNEHKIADAKYTVDQLLTTRPRRDVLIYKMHGDVEHSTNAVIKKEDYQVYHYSHEPFITLLNGDLLSKNFLFPGFSFTDPNSEYIQIIIWANHCHHILSIYLITGNAMMVEIILRNGFKKRLYLQDGKKTPGEKPH
ncbi:SIR2 family protein [Runella slithyformis]|uniref:SIR2 family protein n=1 Tax=Runella slithyformis TaxID=106 RepID=UPI0009DA91D9|nr:SIR2 family protein [Runella slithyformis]